MARDGTRRRAVRIDVVFMKMSIQNYFNKSHTHFPFHSSIMSPFPPTSALTAWTVVV